MHPPPVPKHFVFDCLNSILLAKQKCREKTVLQKDKHQVAMWNSNSTPRHIFNSNFLWLMKGHEAIDYSTSLKCGVLTASSLTEHRHNLLINQSYMYHYCSKGGPIKLSLHSQERKRKGRSFYSLAVWTKALLAIGEAWSELSKVYDITVSCWWTQQGGLGSMSLWISSHLIGGFEQVEW